jgi:protein-disulfide isomerase
MRKMLRRTLSLAGLAAGFAGLGTAAGAQDVPEVLKPLDRDHVLGKADAPITIVEYASLTCPHCAHFHVVVLPELKKKWIDQGKVRLIYRDFPLDRLALQAAIVAECSGKDRYFPVLELLFKQQDRWVAAQDPIAEIIKGLRVAGVGEAEIRACLANEKLISETVLADYQGGDKAGVTGTPTLYINGQKYNGARMNADLDAYLEKLAK